MQRTFKSLAVGLAVAVAAACLLASPASAQTAGQGKFLWNDNAITLSNSGAQTHLILEPQVSGQYPARTIVMHVNLQNAGSTEAYVNCQATTGDGNSDHADVTIPAGKWATVPLVVANSAGGPNRLDVTCGTFNSNIKSFRATAEITYVSSMTFSSCNSAGVCN
jgi:hypothetical protein